MGQTEFLAFASQTQQRINQTLDKLLPESKPGSQNNLLSAMRYSVLLGGKRIRPLLVYAAAHAVNEINADTDRIASAVELIHAYSLIHDDLPAMDDDELRRGQPTCHIAFDEATAILAGDALQTLAFEQLSQLEQTDPKIALKLIQVLVHASGLNGMVAGQAIDIQMVDATPTLDQLADMHRKKTGAMILASISMGALASGVATDKEIEYLKTYGDAIGLAFQVQDDILDVTGTTEVLGKTQGADELHNKPTFASLLGLEQAQEKLQRLHRQSLNALKIFDDRADHLRNIADYIVSRNH